MDDPIPRSTGEELLAQVRDELRGLRQDLRDQASADRGAGELREPAQPKAAAKQAAKPTPKKK